MDLQEAKALPVSTADECEHHNIESAVLKEKAPVSPKRVNINIDRADHVMVGDNNTVDYEKCAGVVSCDRDVINTSQAENESETERLFFRSQTVSPESPSFKFEEDTSGCKATIRASVVQVDFLESEIENSPNKEDFSHVTSTEGKTETMVRLDTLIQPQSHCSLDTRNKTLTLNIESTFVQIGHDNKFCLIQPQTHCSLDTRKLHQHKRHKHARKGQSAALSPGGENAKLAKQLKKFDIVMEKLHKQRDSGDWKQFEEITVKLLAKYPRKKDIHISILLEKSVAANYQKYLQQAEKLAREALSMVQQASQPMVNVFRGRAYYCLSCVYKRTQELEKAFEYVMLSEESLSKTDSLQDKAFLAYEKGCVQQVAAERCIDEATRQRQLQEAKQSFEHCLDLCTQMYEKGEKQFLNKHIFAMMKISMLLLDCRTKAARSRQVSEENIDEAKEYLDKIESEQELWERIACSDIARVQFKLARADYFFRRASYEMAEECAQEAVELARDRGFKTEVEPGLERLVDIRERFEPQTSCEALPDWYTYSGEQMGD